MEIKLLRFQFTDKSTISTLTVDGRMIGFVLEDRDRGLRQDMPLSTINARKVHSVTAIPSGRYEVAMTWSNRFNRVLPLVVNVPGYEGIRLHPGNHDTDSDGCLLPGLTAGPDVVNDSRKAFGVVEGLIRTAVRKEKVWLTIERDTDRYNAYISRRAEARVG